MVQDAKWFSTPKNNKKINNKFEKSYIIQLTGEWAIIYKESKPGWSKNSYLFCGILNWLELYKKNQLPAKGVGE